MNVAEQFSDDHFPKTKVKQEKVMIVDPVMGIKVEKLSSKKQENQRFEQQFSVKQEGKEAVHARLALNVPVQNVDVTQSMEVDEKVDLSQSQPQIPVSGTFLGTFDLSDDDDSKEDSISKYIDEDTPDEVKELLRKLD